VTNGGNVGAMNLTAILNVNGGTVETTNIVGGIGTSTINLNSGTVDLRGTGQISNVTTLAIGDGLASPAQLVNAAKIISPNAITIAANGTLAGHSTVTTPGLIVNGTISPGANGIGQMTATANATFGAGGSFVVAVQNANGSGGSGFDFLQVNGQLNIAATATNPFTVRVQSFANGQIDAMTNFSADAAYDWTIAAAGSITNFDPAKFAVDTSSFENDLMGGYFYVHTNNNALVLSFRANHPPVAATYLLYQTPGGVAIPISSLISNWSDPDGDPVVLSEMDDASTNGVSVRFDGSFIYYTNANNVADTLNYIVQDLRTNPPAAYRNGDTQRTGTGQIVFLPAPAISRLDVSGNNFILGGSNGIAGRTFYLLGTTNVALPFNQWQYLDTNVFDGNGNFDLTNSINPGALQQFYRLQLQ